MQRVQATFGSALVLGLLLCSCGESQEAPSRYNHTLGGVKEGAPLGPVTSDPGILQDAATYQPTRVPGAAAEGGPVAGRAAEATPSDLEGQARAAVSGLLSALRRGDPGLALGAFNSEQVKPLTEKSELLFHTFEKLDAVGRSLKAKLPADAGERLQNVLAAGGAGESKLEVLDARHATVTPNLAIILFGPAKAGPTLALALQDDGWKFQLDAPLTAADADAIVAYHEHLQSALDQLVEWIEATPKLDEAQVQAALTKALLGQPLELQPKEEAHPEGAAEGEGKEQPPTGRGGRVRPPGS